jgi:FkbM family methyltransferase
MKLYYSLAKRLARLGENPVLKRRLGATFLLDRQNWIDNRLIARAPFEDAQLAHARDLVRAEKIDGILDIGANFGLYSIVLAQLPGIAGIEAFEPVRRNHNQLCGNIFANRLDGLITPHCLALSDQTGEARIHIDPRSTGVSALEPERLSRKREVYRESESVTLKRLDDVIAWESRRVFVKIDVEGHALKVLAGMERFLARNSVFAQIELLDGDREDIIKTMQAHGYRLDREISGDGYFLRS